MPNSTIELMENDDWHSTYRSGKGDPRAADNETPSGELRQYVHNLRSYAHLGLKGRVLDR